MTFDPQKKNPDREIVSAIIVRPIERDERAEWDRLMRAHHYLGLRWLVGRTMRYVAICEGKWLALIGWQAAAYKCEARDSWIGWPHLLRRQRLHLIANNSRFLILPGDRIFNLASRILSLNLKRLSKDWLEAHGHPVILAETFVDRERFTGACYRAANWQVVGSTRGFAKSGRRHFRHDHPKEVLVYPLHSHALLHLKETQPQESWRQTMQTVSVSLKQLEDLRQRLWELPDHRKKKGKLHQFATILTIAIGAVLGGARGYTAIAEWASRLHQGQMKRLRARFNHRTNRFEVPSEPTIRRVLQSCDADAVERVFGNWLMEVSGKDEAIAADGKTLRRAVGEDGSQVHLLSALLQQSGVTIAQREVGGKTNEIPELPRLLQPLNIEGRVVSADAMHTQDKTARFIVEEKKADYVFTVKGNQGTLLKDIEMLEEGDFSPGARND